MGKRGPSRTPGIGHGSFFRACSFSIDGKFCLSLSLAPKKPPFSDVFARRRYRPLGLLLDRPHLHTAGERGKPASTAAAARTNNVEEEEEEDERGNETKKTVSHSDQFGKDSPPPPALPVVPIHQKLWLGGGEKGNISGRNLSDSLSVCPVILPAATKKSRPLSDF